MIVLVSFAGRRDQVADVGALGRLAIIFDVVGSILVGLVLPAFTRCQDAVMLKRRYLQIAGGYALIVAGFTGVAALLPGPLLWILGPQYAGLRPELILVVANMSIGNFGAALWSMNAAKGWVHFQWVEIPIRLVFQAILLLYIDTSTMVGALHFMIISQLSPMLFNAGLTVAGFRALTRENTTAATA